MARHRVGLLVLQGEDEERNRGLGEEGWDTGAAEEKANQPCENSGEWPLATSLVGSRVAGEGLGVSSH